MPDNDDNGEALSAKQKKLIREAVEKAVDDRVGGVMLRLKWLGIGLGAMLVLLIASGLVTQSNLVLEVLGRATNFEGYMSRIFEKKIAVSYHNQFWLGTNEDEELTKKLVFYAGPGQSAEMRIDVVHVGPSKPLNLRVWLDENDDDPIYLESKNGPYQKNLSQLAEHTDQGGRPHPNVHELHFEVIEDFEEVTEDGETFVRPIPDSIAITAMVNVYGREQ